MLECTLRVANSSNVGTTGLTGTNIKFRRSPFGSGDEITIAGVSGGTNGIYLCSFIGVPYQAAQLWIDGVYQSTWGTKYIGDISEEYLSKDDTSSQTMAGAIAMGSNKITGLAAGTTNGDAVRYEQVVRTASDQTVAGVKSFSSFPKKSYENLSDLNPSNVDDFATKHYVDEQTSGQEGTVQSTYKIKLLPTRSTLDEYSRTTAELCNSYLSGLASISTRTGTMLVESLGVASNTIDLDDGTSQWISAGVWIVGQGSKPILNRRAPNSSLTVAGGIVNCRIKDGAVGSPVVSSRAYTNFTFQDCEFDVPDETDITFNTCKFLGINKLKSASDNTITLSNCTGDAFWHNDDITPTITGTRPIDVRAVTAANLNW